MRRNYTVRNYTVRWFFEQIINLLRDILWMSSYLVAGWIVKPFPKKLSKTADTLDWRILTTGLKGKADQPITENQNRNCENRKPKNLTKENRRICIENHDGERKLTQLSVRKKCANMGTKWKNHGNQNFKKNLESRKTEIKNAKNNPERRSGGPHTSDEWIQTYGTTAASADCVPESRHRATARQLSIRTRPRHPPAYTHRIARGSTHYYRRGTDKIAAAAFPFEGEQDAKSIIFQYHP